jgi:hypothetical protein
LHLGRAHRRGDAKYRPDAIDDAADTPSGISFKDDIVARAALGLVGDPGGDTACPIAGNFGDGAVCIMQADAALALSFPGQELHSVGSYAVVAVTKPARQSIAGLGACEIFLDHEEIISAGVRFHERDHSSSASCLSVMLTSRGHASV